MAEFSLRPEAEPVEVEYHSFELSPDTPVDFQGSAADYLANRKGIPAEEVSVMIERITGIAESVGLRYDYDALQHTNTVKAHQLLHFAKAEGLQLELKERLLRAYFVQGRHVGRIDDMADLAAEVGLDRDEALESLRSDEYLPAVHADQRQAQAYGIQGVPFFVIDQSYGISGAQESEIFARVLSRVADERAQVPA